MKLRFFAITAFAGLFGCGEGVLCPAILSSTGGPVLITKVLSRAWDEWPYDEGMLVCAGGTPPFTWEITGGALPAWANAPTGAGDTVFITGTPPAGATNSGTFTVTVRDAEGRSDSREFELKSSPTQPDDFMKQVDYPDLTNTERKVAYQKTKQEWQAYYADARARARDLSDRLRGYILKWLHEGADSRLPNDLLPPSINNAKTRSWRLLRPEEVNPDDQWIVLPMHEPDPTFKALDTHSPDPHTTYFRLIFLAPFGAQLLVEGDFPHARFMNYQVLQPFDPVFPASGADGGPEVPMVDVDIDPDPGHTNPFRTGADRNATLRHYHVTFDLKEGNAAALNPEVMQLPHRRAPGNTRVAGPMGFAGTYGGAVLSPSILWLRYYAPDNGAGVLAGVPKPKALLRLDTGETFWLQCDFSLHADRWTVRWPLEFEPPTEPPPIMGPTAGWVKGFDILENRLTNPARQQAEPFGKFPAAPLRKSVRDKMAGLYRRGPQFEAPGNMEQSATAFSYAAYIDRPLSIGPDKVFVLTGKMPTTPATRGGEPTMTPAEARYWSITRYARSSKTNQGLAVLSIMDDETVRNAENKYIIVFSTPKNRPANATAENGVTWRNYGFSASGSMVIRWVSVWPDHWLEAFNPHALNVPWATADWSQDAYDETIIGLNQPGVMGPYHPIVHYMTKAQFEALGTHLDPDAIPPWTDGTPGPGPGPSPSPEKIKVSLKRLGDRQIEIQWTEEKGLAYTVQFRDSLVQGAWSPLPPVDRWPIQAASITATVAPGSAIRFFRVIGGQSSPMMSSADLSRKFPIFGR